MLHKVYLQLFTSIYNYLCYVYYVWLYEVLWTLYIYDFMSYD